MKSDSQAMRDYILRLSRERGKTLKELSHLIGKGDSYMHSYVRKGAPRRLFPADVATIADAIGARPEELYAGRALPFREGDGDGGLQPTPPADNMPLRQAWTARDIPILGGVQGGQEGVFANDGTVLGWADRPPSLAGVDDAYYAKIFGDSMHPMYKHGEGVWVNPTVPLEKGKGVVVVLAPDEDGGDMRFFVKEFVRRTGTHLICRQYHPECEVKYRLDSVARMDRVVARDES